MAWRYACSHHTLPSARERANRIELSLVINRSQYRKDAGRHPRKSVHAMPPSHAALSSLAHDFMHIPSAYGRHTGHTQLTIANRNTATIDAGLNNQQTPIGP